MGLGFNDIYVLSPERSADAALRFLDRFVPSREPSQTEYGFPDNPERRETTFWDVIEALRYCAAHPRDRYGFYFRNTTAKVPAHAMVFFTGGSDDPGCLDPRPARRSGPGGGRNRQLAPTAPRGDSCSTRVRAL
jgi:hypothetical protein